EMNEATHDESQREVAIERCRVIAETCAELGCKVSFGSDAHIATRIADAHSVIKQLEEIDFPEELMACRDAQTFLDTIANAKIPASKQGY
ncbi:MAG: histidinol-phosphatase, partial [Lancefieldella parvula]